MQKLKILIIFTVYLRTLSIAQAKCGVETYNEE
jgi:hypothetical protein